VTTGYAGPNSVMSQPYAGTPPHGEILDTFDSTLTVNGTSGEVLARKIKIGFWWNLNLMALFIRMKRNARRLYCLLSGNAWRRFCF